MRGVTRVIVGVWVVSVVVMMVGGLGRGIASEVRARVSTSAPTTQNIASYVDHGRTWFVSPRVAWWRDGMAVTQGVGVGTALALLPVMLWMLKKDFERRRGAWVRKDDLVGKWRLVRAGGELPAELNIQSHEVEIREDGTWVATTQMQGAFEGVTAEGEGTWTLAGNVLAHVAGEHSGKSRVRVSGTLLELEPDMLLVRGGREPVAGEYARASQISGGVPALRASEGLR